MKTLMVVFALFSLATETIADDRFNCPEPVGSITLDSDHWNAMPTHLERVLPFPIDVDFVCRIDGDGNFVGCTFAARQELTKAQTARLNSYVTRFMRYVKSDKPNQRCVASKIRIEMPATASN